MLFREIAQEDNEDQDGCRGPWSLWTVNDLRTWACAILTETVNKDVLIRVRDK